MAGVCGQWRLKKKKGETFLTAGMKVWEVEKLTVTCRGSRRKKPVGEVVKDSCWPDMWVTVTVWNKEWVSKKAKEGLL
jgi:hypothetical protein